MELHNVRLYKKTSKKPRKIAKINSSRYETAEAIHTNKKYWKHVFDEINTNTSETVSTCLLI